MARFLDSYHIELNKLSLYETAVFSVLTHPSFNIFLLSFFGRGVNSVYVLICVNGQEFNCQRAH